jgi:hypothetical protein
MKDENEENLRVCRIDGVLVDGMRPAQFVYGSAKGGVRKRPRNPSYRVAREHDAEMHISRLHALCRGFAHERERAVQNLRGDVAV